MNYPKLETLWDRDPKTFKTIPGLYRLAEFSLVNRWTVTEKIDGDNVRVHLIPETRVEGESEGLVVEVPTGETTIRYSARNGGEHLKPGVREWLEERLPAEHVAAAFAPGTEAYLYGEAYGERIQKGGGNYRKGVAFRLFDVAVGTSSRIWWLDLANVEAVAAKLGIETAPVLARGATLDQAVAMVKNNSTVAHLENSRSVVHEGIVCRTEPLLLTRAGARVAWKLKVRDLA